MFVALGAELKNIVISSVSGATVQGQVTNAKGWLNSGGLLGSVSALPRVGSF